MELRYFLKKIRYFEKKKIKIDQSYLRKIVTILWQMVVSMETDLLFNEYIMVCNKIERFLRSVWKQEYSLLSCLFGTLELERKTICKYNPAYSMGKNVFIVLHVFQNSCIDLHDVHMFYVLLLWHHESMFTNNKSHDKNKVKFSSKKHLRFKFSSMIN